jgi:hypothetical protein
MRETRLLLKVQQATKPRQPWTSARFPDFFDETFQPWHPSPGDKKAACWQTACSEGCTVPF